MKHFWLMKQQTSPENNLKSHIGSLILSQCFVTGRQNRSRINNLKGWLTDSRAKHILVCQLIRFGLRWSKMPPSNAWQTDAPKKVRPTSQDQWIPSKCHQTNEPEAILALLSLPSCSPRVTEPETVRGHKWINMVKGLRWNYKSGAVLKECWNTTGEWKTAGANLSQHNFYDVQTLLPCRIFIYVSAHCTCLVLVCLLPHRGNQREHHQQAKSLCVCACACVCVAPSVRVRLPQEVSALFFCLFCQSNRISPTFLNLTSPLQILFLLSPVGCPFPSSLHV